MDILTVNNVYRLHTLKFTYAWHKGILPKVFDHFFQYASNVHHHKQKLYKIRIKTNTGKRMVSFAAIDLWQEIPQNFKDLNPFSFSKSTKNYLLIQQHQTYSLPPSLSPLI